MKPVRGTYTFVEGPSLGAFLLEVRQRFTSAPALADDAEGAAPNSIQLVASDVFDELSPAGRAAVLLDLLEGNVELFFVRDLEEVFAAAHTPQDCLIDIVCEVATAVLRRDPGLHAEDELRLALAA